MSNNQSNNLEWKFLKDQPVESEKEDILKIHTSYAEALFDIIMRCETPFSVGIFGSWGTGKTTVVNILEKLIEEKSKCKWLYFDVWKFSKEPLKRWILLEMEKQLKNQDEEQDEEFENYKFENRSLKSHLEYEEEWEEKPEIKIDTDTIKKVFKRCLWIGIGVVIASFLFFSLAQFWKLLQNFLSPTSGIFLALGSTILISSFVIKKFAENLSGLAFERRMKKTTALPTFSAEKFEDIFKDMIEKAIKNNSDNKLVVIFDNIDRCQAEVALETISVVKTFLELGGCVYIIPCDEEAIVHHILQSQTVEDNKTGGIENKQNYDPKSFAREFLRKFFQLILRLPDIPKSDREKFIDEQLKKAKLYLPPEAKDVVTIAYGGKTPRQIKRFINDFIGYLILAYKIERKGLLNSGDLTTNLNFLAKMIVFFVEWPDFLKRLTTDPELLNDCSEKIRRGEEVKDEDEGLVQFLKATRDIEAPTDIRPYLYLKRVEYEKDSQLAITVRDNLSKGEEEYFLTLLGENERVNDVLKISLGAVEEWLQTKRPLYIKNSLRVFLKIFSQIPEDFIRKAKKLTSELLNNTFLVFDSVELSPIEPFDIQEIISFCSQLSKIQREPIIDKYVKTFTLKLEVTDDRRKIWNFLIGRKDLLSTPQKKQIKEGLTSRYEKEEKQVLDLINYIVAKKAENDFIGNNLPTCIMEKFTVSPNEDNKKRWETYREIKTFSSPKTRQNLVDKLTEAVRPARSATIDNINQFAIEILNILTPEDLDGLKVGEVYGCLRDQMARTPLSQRASWADVLLRRIKAFDPNQQNEIRAHMGGIVTHPNIDELLAFLNSLKKDTCATMFSFGEVKEKIRGQAQRLQQQFGLPAAQSYKKRLLNNFPEREVLRNINEVIDPNYAWDVMVGLEIISAPEENYIIERIGAETFTNVIREFMGHFVKDKVIEQKGIIIKIIGLIEKYTFLQKERDFIETLGEYTYNLFKKDTRESEALKNIVEYLPKKSKDSMAKKIIENVGSYNGHFFGVLSMLINDMSKATKKRVMDLIKNLLGPAEKDGQKDIVLDFLIDSGAKLGFTEELKEALEALKENEMLGEKVERILKGVKK